MAYNNVLILESETAALTMALKHTKHWLVIGILLITANQLFAQTAIEATSLASIEPKFVRLSDDAAGEPRALQVAIVRYAPVDDGSDNHYVDLISAVHIGDKSYYQQLNQIFENYDAVLFELVIPENESLAGLGNDQVDGAGTEASVSDNPVKTTSTKNTDENRDDRASEIGFSMVSTFQRWMKNALGLSFQLEQVDYSRPNLVHADMTTTEFKASMNDRGESLFSTFMKMWRASIRQSMARPVTGNEFDIFKVFFSSNRELAMKQVMANEFINMELLDTALSKGDGSTLLTERNKKALQVLRSEITKGKQKIAIFYGAAHMPDIGKRLISEFDLLPVEITWLDAWDLTE